MILISARQRLIWINTLTGKIEAIESRDFRSSCCQSSEPRIEWKLDSRKIGNLSA